MKYLLLFSGILCFVFHNSANAQIELSRIQEYNSFIPLQSGEIEVSDVNKDGFEDIFITGNRSYRKGFSQLFINDGTGLFIADESNVFEPLSSSSASFGDVDGDNDFDLLISGLKDDQTPFSQLYINDGSGVFIPNSNLTLIEVHHSEVKIIDLNNDDLPELFITGTDKDQNEKLSIYLNQGQGDFLEIVNHGLQAVEQAQQAPSASFGDIDGDEFVDLVLSGEYLLTEPSGFRVINSTISYRNDHTGHFQVVNDTIEKEHHISVNHLLDLDGDNDLDLLLSGRNSSSDYFTKTYLNEGDGAFRLIHQEVFDKLLVSSIVVGNLDNDPIEEIYMTGLTESYAYEAYVMEVNPDGFLIEQPTGDLAKFVVGDAELADFNGDNLLDIVLFGGIDRNSTAKECNVYYNNGQGVFNKAQDLPLVRVSNANLTYADIDGDTDLDLLISGKNINQKPISYIYANISGEYVLQDTTIQGVVTGEAVFADIDGDYDKDLLIAGIINSEGAAKTTLYINDGEGNFSQMNTVLPDLGTPSFKFADIDNDDDLDLLITGSLNGGSTPFTGLYNNDGKGVFSELQSNFPDLKFSGVDFADIDGDNDLDLIITGNSYRNSGRTISNTKLYLNDGNGDFEEVLETPFIIVSNADVKFADFDDDGDQDLLILGYNDRNLLNEICTLYENDGTGQFTIVDNTPFAEVIGKIEVGDLNNDNLPEIIITGTVNFSALTKCYLNLGQNQFEEILTDSLNQIYYSDVLIYDINNDAKKDVVIAGADFYDRQASIYMNTSSIVITSNTDPESNSDKTYSVYPNPFNEMIHFTNEMVYEIFSETGQLLLQGKGKSVNMENFSSGIYFIKTPNSSVHLIKK